MHRVRNAFSGANDGLTLVLLKKAQNLIDLGRQYYERDRTGRRFQAYVEPDYTSILDSMVGVTDEVSEYLPVEVRCNFCKGNTSPPIDPVSLGKWYIARDCWRAASCKAGCFSKIGNSIEKIRALETSFNLPPVQESGSVDFCKKYYQSEAITESGPVEGIEFNIFNGSRIRYGLV